MSDATSRRIVPFLQAILRLAAAGGWCLLGLWTALAVYFTAPLPYWLAVTAAVAIVLVFASSLFEPVRFYQLLWPPRKFGVHSLAALAVYLVVAVYYFGFVKPDANQVWSPEQALMPIVDIEGDKIHVRNVRDFVWKRSADGAEPEFTPHLEERTYDLNLLNSMYYVVVPMPSFDGVAHVFVSFGFSDGQHVAVSVEGRRVKDRPYQIIPSMFKQYQLIYIVGEERDVVGLRGKVWQKPVYFYPARTTDERKRAIFRDMMERAHELEEHPEFYHLITNNCMNNITAHLRRLGGRPLPHDLWVLLTGFSDRIAFNLGYLDTELTFPQARRAFRVDTWMRDTPLDESFSERMRKTIEQQVAAEKAAATASLPD